MAINNSFLIDCSTVPASQAQVAELTTDWPSTAEVPACLAVLTGFSHGRHDANPTGEAARPSQTRPNRVKILLGSSLAAANHTLRTPTGAHALVPPVIISPSSRDFGASSSSRPKARRGKARPASLSRRLTRRQPPPSRSFGHSRPPMYHTHTRAHTT